MKRPVRLLLGLTLLLVYASCAGEAPPIATHEKLSGLTEYIESSFADWDVPGLAVAVVYEGELAYAQGFGVQQIGREEAVDAYTLFQVGSVTKSFGAAAIGALVDDGKLDWDDPVVKHLPWFALSDPEITQKVTVRDLLCHRSGIPEDLYPAMEVMSGRATAERARLLGNYGAYGTYRYSNLGYGLLSLIVEEVTGESWNDWVRERIFEPLRMKDSAGSPYGVWEQPYVAPTFLGTAPAGDVSLDDAPGKNVAMPHGVDRDGRRRVLSWQSYDNMQAAGSLVSNVVDMGQWLRMHVGEGSVDGRRVLSDAVVRELHTPQTETQSYFIFSEGPETSYAMGWEIERFGGTGYHSHGGGIFGFPAYIAILPELQAGVVVLANGSMWTPYYPHQEITAWVFAQLLELEPRDWHAEAMERTAAIQAQVDQAFAAFETNPDAPKPSLSLAAYAGRYRDAYSAELIVEAKDDRLRLSFIEPGSFSADVEPWNGDTFLLHYHGGDGQALSRSPAAFVVENDQVSVLNLGRMGQYTRVE